MKKYEILPARTLADVVCDVCGKSCKTPLDDYEYATLSASWGYSSRKDGVQYEADLCEDCFDNMVAYVGGDATQRAERPKTD